MAEPFAYVRAINEGKNIVRDNGETEARGYMPYLTNRAFSYHKDTLFYANEMNLYNNVDNILQYEYYLHSLRPRKRFAKWPKKSVSERLDIVMEYYGVNPRRAEEYLALLDDAQIELLRSQLQKGGRQ